MSAYIRSLTHAEQLVGAVGLTIEYPYDDLIIVENNPFLLRFDAQNSQKMYLHFNHDCELTERLRIDAELAKKAKELGIILSQHADYSFKQQPNAELVDIVFERAI